MTSLKVCSSSYGATGVTSLEFCSSFFMERLGLPRSNFVLVLWSGGLTSLKFYSNLFTRLG